MFSAMNYECLRCGTGFKDKKEYYEHECEITISHFWELYEERLDKLGEKDNGGASKEV